MPAAACPSMPSGGSRFGQRGRGRARREHLEHELDGLGRVGVGQAPARRGHPGQERAGGPAGARAGGIVVAVVVAGHIATGHGLPPFHRRARLGSPSPDHRSRERPRVQASRRDGAWSGARRRPAGRRPAARVRPGTTAAGRAATVRLRPWPTASGRSSSWASPTSTTRPPAPRVRSTTVSARRPGRGRAELAHGRAPQQHRIGEGEVVVHDEAGRHQHQPAPRQAVDGRHAEPDAGDADEGGRHARHPGAGGEEQRRDRRDHHGEDPGHGGRGHEDAGRRAQGEAALVAVAGAVDEGVGGDRPPGRGHRGHGRGDGHGVVGTRRPVDRRGHRRRAGRPGLPSARS